MKLFKYVPAAIILSVTFNQAPAADEENDVRTPDIKSQTEIENQLMELAVANFDSNYYRQLLRLHKSKESGNYPTELAISYLMIRNFREKIPVYSWAEKQHLSFPKDNTEFLVEDVEKYNDLIASGNIWNELVGMRPNVPSYLVFRTEIQKQMKSLATSEEPYTFRLIKPGFSGPQIDIIKKVMIAGGYLDENCPLDGYYDLELTEAMKKFQSDNGLKPDGIIGEMTYDLLFKNSSSKAVSLARSLIRMSDNDLYSNAEYVFVNIPSLNMHVISDSKNIMESKVIVGRNDRQTPTLKSQINNVVLNPVWTAPSTISQKDYLPKIRADRYYLAKKGLNLYMGSEKVDPSTLTPDDLTKSGFRKYRITQAPGAKNAMGQYKFNFPNSESVYLHSTNSPSGFNKSLRTLSSGCVRVQKSNELAKYLLRNEMKPERIDKIVASGKTFGIPLSSNVPVYIAYWTSYIDGDGKFVYLPDIYNLDRKAEKLPLDLINLYNQENENL